MLACVLGITKRGNKGITKRIGFSDCKSGHEGLQIGAT